jgi:hypothetical protein
VCLLAACGQVRVRGMGAWWRWLCRGPLTPRQQRSSCWHAAAVSDALAGGRELRRVVALGGLMRHAGERCLNQTHVAAVCHAAASTPPPGACV